MSRAADFPPIADEDCARGWDAEEHRDHYQKALEMIATGRATGLTAAETLSVCRDIAKKALESVLGPRADD